MNKIPLRIQRKRVKGWRMPPDTIYVGRPSKFGNPFVDPDWAVTLFREYAIRQLARNPNWLIPLRGKNLACWCKPSKACHADVLLELANPEGV